ncbi:MAG: galactokinase, partial [Clostridia bacterium]|nr:galactokinase [Clostridia bacterium]
MFNAESLKKAILNGDYNKTFEKLYPNSQNVAERYVRCVDKFVNKYGDSEGLRLFSAPGRTEVGGNHTDHQQGCVLAAGVDLDVIAVARKTDTGIIRIQSEGFAEDVIDLSVLTPQEDEVEHAPALVRGVAARFKQLGYEIGGFDAYTTSNVLKGSGLSSSAAFEVLVCTLLNSLYNDEKMDSVEKAIVSQYAENEFFKKPCGLMDQMACSYGGFVGIDFDDTANPVIEKVDFDFKAVDHSLCIVDTGGCHADLTGDYAGVPAEMKAVAAYFGKGVLRDVDEDEFYSSIPKLRETVSDRAILRSIHFFNDNRRAVELKEKLKANDFDGFKKIISESGRSSLQCLQNVFAASNPSEQGLTLALTLTEKILNGKGAFRVHGGGFAGTIQAFVPNDILPEYKQKIEKVFGEGKCYVL